MRYSDFRHVFRTLSNVKDGPLSRLLFLLNDNNNLYLITTNKGKDDMTQHEKRYILQTSYKKKTVMKFRFKNIPILVSHSVASTMARAG